VAVAVAAGAAAVWWRPGGTGHSPAAAGSPSSPQAGFDAQAGNDLQKYAPIRAAVSALFAARAAALRSGDLSAWKATVDPTRPALAKSQTMLFTNLRQLPLSRYSWGFDTTTQISGVPLPDSVKATLGAADEEYCPGMVVTYQLRGFDPQPVKDPYVPLVVRRGSHWYVAGDRTRAATFDESYDEPWTAGPIKVSVTRHAVVVVSTRDASRLSALDTEADDAVAVVESLWPSGWNHNVVLFASRDRDVFSSFVGRNGTTPDFSALSTAVGAFGRSRPESLRVVLNTAEVAPGSSFLPVLLRHEFTHVAQWNTHAPGTPLWAIEGIAEYTSYLHHLTLARVASHLVALAKANRWPSHMPASVTFYGPDPGQTYHYDMAWLAWEYMSERYGESTVKRVYARLSSIQAPMGSAAALKQEAATFPALLHISETSFVKRVEAWTAQSFGPA